MSEPKQTAEEQQELDWLVGNHAVREALCGGVAIEKVVAAAEMPPGRSAAWRRLAAEKGCLFQSVPRLWLDRLAQPLAQAHQGVAARISAVEPATIEDLFASAAKAQQVPLFLLLDGIQDPHNLGAIARTAVAAGVHGIIIPRHRAAGVTQAVLTASVGAAAHLPIARVNNLNQEVRALKKQGFWIAAADPTASLTYDHIPAASYPLALILGGEGKGLRPSLQAHCDGCYSIPMYGAVASLNVSVAAALFLYAIRAARAEKSPQA